MALMGKGMQGAHSPQSDGAWTRLVEEAMKDDPALVAPRKLPLRFWDLWRRQFDEPTGVAERPPVARVRPFAAHPQVLLIEDDADLRDSLADILTKRGYVIVQARSGLEGVRHLRAAPPFPAAILLDVNLPAMNGFEFREQQRNHPVWSRIPVIVISSDLHAVAEGKALGAAAALRKPLDLQALLSTLSDVCAASPIRRPQGT
jgi:CheY-like chemotaxis protein